jgi:hypothetical protein
VADRWEGGRRVFDLARTIIPAWIEVDLLVPDRARTLLDDDPALTARDALHAAAQAT